MDNVWGSNVSQLPPTIPADAPTGYPTDGSASGAVDATVPRAFWYHSVSQEILNAIIGGGITPDRQDLTQLDQSIKAQCQAVYDRIIPLIRDLQVQVNASETVPTGLIAYFTTNTPPNANWLVCAGGNVSRTTYANLFAKIGTTYGAGNGSTTFTLPNLVGKVAWGANGGVGGEIQAGVPNVTGRFMLSSDTNGYESLFQGAFYKEGGAIGRYAGDRDDSAMPIYFDAARCSAVYGRSNTVQPPALKLLPCIHI